MPSPCIEVGNARAHNLRSVSCTFPKHALIGIAGPSGSGKTSFVFHVLAQEAERIQQCISGNFAAIRLERDYTFVRGIGATISLRDQSERASYRSLAQLSGCQELIAEFFQRAGVQHCMHCAATVPHSFPNEIIDNVLTTFAGMPVEFCAVLRLQSTEEAEVFRENMLQRGFLRLYLDDALESLDERSAADIVQAQEQELLLDAFIPSALQRSRLVEVVTLAKHFSVGIIVRGAHEGRGTKTKFYWKRVCPTCHAEYDEQLPFRFSAIHPQSRCTVCLGRGVVHVAGQLEVCPACHGSRIEIAARSWSIGKISYEQFSRSSIAEARALISEMSLPMVSGQEVGNIFNALLFELSQLEKLGLGYLQLSRAAVTLSRGEFQRVLLSRALGRNGKAMTYLLDFPLASLHPKDSKNVADFFEQLKKSGTTIIAIESEPQFLRRCDEVLRFGPGRGHQGGEIVWQGSGKAYNKKYLRKPALFQRSSRPLPKQWISLRGASRNNLKNITVRFPLGVLSAVCGVSGSGKSTLILDCLVPTLRQVKARKSTLVAQQPPRTMSMEGAEDIRRVVEVGRLQMLASKRSTVATMTGILGDLRELFSQTVEAKMRGMNSASFSFNSPRGWCPACKGTAISESRQPCLSCRGHRFRSEVDFVRYRDRTLPQLLDCTLEEVAQLGIQYSPLRMRLECYAALGLQALRLSQPSSELSQGEFQRIHLARELSSGQVSGSIFVLDEPSRGLDEEEIAEMLSVFENLCAQGATVVVVDHSLSLLRAAQYLVELGPGAGTQGGEIIFSGTLADVHESSRSQIREYLTEAETSARQSIHS